MRKTSGIIRGCSNVSSPLPNSQLSQAFQMEENYIIIGNPMVSKLMLI
jgi:hypothetical protein